MIERISQIVQNCFIWFCIHTEYIQSLFSVFLDDIHYVWKKGRISVACEGLDENVDNGEPTIFLDHEYLFNERASIPNWVLPPIQAPIKDSLPKQSNYWMTMQGFGQQVPRRLQCAHDFGSARREKRIMASGNSDFELWNNLGASCYTKSGRNGIGCFSATMWYAWGFSPAYRHSFVAHRGAITFPPIWNILTEVSSLSAPVRFPQDTFLAAPSIADGYVRSGSPATPAPGGPYEGLSER